MNTRKGAPARTPSQNTTTAKSQVPSEGTPGSPDTHPPLAVPVGVVVRDLGAANERAVVDLTEVEPLTAHTANQLPLPSGPLLLTGRRGLRATVRAAQVLGNRLRGRDLAFRDCPQDFRARLLWAARQDEVSA